jgi:hypothetical protein
MHDPGSKYATRPAPCRECGSSAWWNGTRVVAPMRQEGDESVHIPETIRRRARCSRKGCSAGSWTVYEGCDYPHRVFQLDVVFAAVCMASAVDATLTAVAAAHRCTRDSVRRWLGWVSGLAEPRDLERLCSRLDSEGLPTTTTRGSRAAQVIALLERLAELLSLRGVDLPGLGAGLVRLLVDRLVRFGEVFYLTKSSPPLRADLAGLVL